METGGPDDGPVEAEPELLEYDDADRNGQDYSKNRQNRAQNAKNRQFGGFGGWEGSGSGWEGSGSGRGTGGSSNANVVQRGRPGGTANANIVQGPGGPRGRMMYNTADASGCRCYFKGKPCSGRGKGTSIKKHCDKCFY